ncbi:MAG: L-2-hydroxyglutarate oxidase, partial [Actinobacteria bacterium]|nr:L-2-hydroxyglutarate oxidase [Actinomycetota bacterium]
MAANNFDFGVIGAGIVGLAMANRIRQIHPNATIAVFDKEKSVGEHASGRNSGVLHAGFYYSPDSLKAALTRDGNKLLRDFCTEEKIPVKETGKVVVAQNSSELTALQELHRRGNANGVITELVSPEQLVELEPLAKTSELALWSPHTAVANPLEVTQALANKVVREGITLKLGHEVLRTTQNRIITNLGNNSVGHIINCAGLYADKIAKPFGYCDDYAMLPFKGLYWYGNWAPGKLARHVYPVPDVRNPFLGVHLTVTIDGRVKIGPTAIPIFSRESYAGFGGLSAKEILNIVGIYPKFLSSKHHDVVSLIKSEMPKYSQRHLVTQAKALVPSIDPRDFKERGKPGIRAQLLDIKNKKLEMDFVVRGDENSTH